MTNHGAILDDDPVLTTLQVDRHLLNGGHHDTYFGAVYVTSLNEYTFNLLDQMYAPSCACFQQRVVRDVFLTLLAALDWLDKRREDQAASLSQLINCGKALGDNQTKSR